jgi:short subunit dehydrogenase-like uncharacterized protein
MSMRMYMYIQLCISTMSNCHSTGETPWIKLIIEKYHETAKANGAIVRSTTIPKGAA